MNVQGGKLVILERGDTFYESPEDIHTIEKNASGSQSAKFLVFFCERQRRSAGLSSEIGLLFSP